ncbi:OmpA family protein [Paucibacter sp. hw1]|uniref:OmpA family protein n=2 Tax=Roseateles koreensis TaxID=2987526 RepID=A0ABT5KS31_9BURK|nr:OmpA family protein [Roseateles koreensis]
MTPRPLFAALTRHDLARTSALLMLVLLFLQLGACNSPPPAPPTPQSVFEHEVQVVTESLLAQWRAQAKSVLIGPGRQRVSVGAITDQIGPTEGAPATPASPFMQQGTRASAQVRHWLAARLSALETEFELREIPPLQTGDPLPTTLLLTGTLSHKPTSSHLLESRQHLAAEKPPGPSTWVLTLSLIDLNSHQVLARQHGPVHIDSAASLPAPYFQDSPVLLPARPGTLLSERQGNTIKESTHDDMVTQTLLAQGQDAYATGAYAHALRMFEAAAQWGGQSLRAYNGQYLSHLKLGQQAQAHQAFHHMVATGLASRTLAVKFLFMPGQTAFWADSAVSSAYDFWLTEISSQVAAGTHCLEITGHTSRSGTEAFNRQLSLARSDRVRNLMVEKQAGLSGRLSTQGRGWLDNLVGSGSDDARDAIDRRVEFKVLDCAG